MLLVPVSVGTLRGAETQRLVAVTRLPDHLDAGEALQQLPDAGPEQRMIVGDEDPDRHAVSPILPQAARVP